MPLKYSVPFKKMRECLNGTKGFKLHMPFKTFMSIKKTRIFLNDINDLNDINGKPRGELARLQAFCF